MKPHTNPSLRDLLRYCGTRILIPMNPDIDKNAMSSKIRRQNVALKAERLLG
jgi:hypothetical protein